MHTPSVLGYKGRVTYLGECWSCHNVSSWNMTKDVSYILSKADLSCLHPNLSFAHSFINPPSEFFPFPFLPCPTNDEFYIVVFTPSVSLASVTLRSSALPPPTP